MFKVGQKVVCIDGAPNENTIVPYLPIAGEIYTIREVRIGYGLCGLLLEEIINPLMEFIEGRDEGAFASYRFRPIDYEFGKIVCESLKVMTEPELV